MMANVFERHRIHTSKNFHHERDLSKMSADKFSTLPRNMYMGQQCSLVSSMDLLSSKARPVSPCSMLQQTISIHGTLPRKKKGIVPFRSCEMYTHMGTLPHSKSRPSKSRHMYDAIDEYPPHVLNDDMAGFRDKGTTDPAMEYVKFSKDRYIMDGTPEKLRKELEEELKLSSEELRSHAWYHGRIPRQVAESVLKRDGDFLIRDSLSSPGNFVLTCLWKSSPQHFRINKVIIKLNDAYTREQYQLERESFDNIPALVMYYVGNRKSLSQQSGTVISHPVNRALPLRVTEEKFVSIVNQSQIAEEKKEITKRLSLNIANGLSHEQALIQGNLLRNKEKCGSQPASLDHMPEKRRPLKAHQSESHLPLGSKALSISPTVDTNTLPRSPVFRTGSEPVLSPAMLRKITLEGHAGEALRGSDSQLCPKPPPKPSKVPSMRRTHSPLLQPQPEFNYCELHPIPLNCRKKQHSLSQIDSYVERLKTEESKHIPYRKSETNFCILEPNNLQQVKNTLNDQNEKENEDVAFIKPVFETVSSFKPNSFESKLLPAEHKPLDTSALKRVKELFHINDTKTIGKHILKMDCKVARIVDVSEEVKGMMGVSSGLELITLPHGHQLRLDLIERHSTMAISIAVDILGCTGNVDERAATLNKIIQLAVELKDSMGDLFAFSAIMKALDMPQIARLEQMWTTLRRQHTHTAIIYEKCLKPFMKALHEGSGVPLSDTTVPLLMPLVTLMERQAVAFESMDQWEKNDQNCEIMMKHLDMARSVAQNADVYRTNAQKILEDFKPDEELLEMFKTEFQMRLLWGSKGAQVNQTERYEKFHQILTALSRKLEPLVKYSDV
ncbi:breast cancer anti-estrogen resistance protein 3 isoform X1 [Protopterus annectens]|uniref:breast cancer anti-estrogen resistance protein 3 isoform X1 n=1 Tax=Protopterus annectens TaxID=7888 RepID=UPI001CFAC28A|nr:breast cancer anti-estrogen resistance protein 3 isoform X1 [Protopterus annectens]